MNKKLLCIVIGVAGLLTSSILLYVTWLGAFFNGGRITIDINSANEMWIEFFAIPVIMFLGFYSVYYLFKTSLRRYPFEQQ